MSTKAAPLPEISYLHEVLEYEESTGVLTWKERPRHHFTRDNEWKTFNIRFAGKPAGSKAKSGHLTIRLDNKLLLCHRVAWKLATGNDPKNLIDHINNKPDDNRIVNLREATHSQNLCNRGATKQNKSGHKRVIWNKKENKWQSNISFNKKQKFLGLFENIDDAIAAYKKASAEIHGEFAYE